MKKVSIVSLLLSLAFLAGCAAPSETAKSIGLSNMPEHLNIYTDAAFLDAYATIDQTAADNWMDYMSETYQTIVTISNLRVKFEWEKLNLDMTKANGMVHLYQGEINQCMNNNDILPLEDYLKDNKVWNSLPEDFRNRFMKDGHIWAIPRSTDINIEVLSVNTEWLETTGLSKPQTMEELLKAGATFQKNDANGDGVKNDYLFGIPYMLSRDIFASFGLYYTGKSQAVAYNPNKKCFEDSALQDNTKTMLEFIRKSYTDGLIAPDALLATTDIAYKNSIGAYGTVQGNVALGKYEVSFNAKRAAGMTESDLLTNYESITGTYEALDPLSGENPVTYSDDGQCYVLSKATDDPKAVVNVFVDMLFGSIKSYCSMSIGVPDNYKISNDVITCNYSDEDTKTLPLRANLVDAIDLLGESNYVIINPENNAKLEQKIQKDAKEYQDKYIKRNTENGKLVKISPFLLADHLRSGGGYLNVEFQNMMTGVLKPNNKIAILIETYRNTATVQSFYEQRIKMLNEINGLSSAK